MDRIKKIQIKDYEAFARIAIKAYPPIVTPSEDAAQKFAGQMIKQQQGDRTVTAYGLYRKQKLLGGLRLHDFQMTMYSTIAPAGGGGLLAVDLVHKKEHVARDLMIFFLEHFRKRGYPLATLYPFRPDFYRQMGFGYGPRLNQFRFNPADLPPGHEKKHIVPIGKEDVAELAKCHDRIAARTHGMMKTSNFQIERLLRPIRTMVGYRKGRRLLGYMAFTFQPYNKDNFVSNDLVISEFLYQDREVFHEFMAFLRSQADQVRHIVYNTFDDYFHFYPVDPRDDSDNMIAPVYHQSNVQGIGIMYRVIDIPRLFEVLKDHDFGGQTLRVKMTIADSFLPDNAGTWVIHAHKGKVKLKSSCADADVEIKLDIAEFSSMIMGVIGFGDLYRLGLAEISDTGRVVAVDRLLFSGQKPICTAQF